MAFKISPLEREDFLSWLAGELQPKMLNAKTTKEIEKHIDARTIVLLWENSVDQPRSSCNPLVILQNDSKNDFLAWVSTYVSTFTPFSAFFRLLTERNLSLIDQKDQIQLFDKRKLTENLTCVVIAEAISELYDFSSARRLSLSSCEATFSYSVLRSLTAGYGAEDFASLSAYWNATRDIIFDQDAKHIGMRAERSEWLDSIVEFWSLISDPSAKAFGSSRRTSNKAFKMIGQLILSCEEGREASSNKFESIISEISGDIAQLSLLDAASKERQVQSFDESVRNLSTRRIPATVRNALIGFSAARVANGSFEYLNLLAEDRRNLQGVYPWFAYFSIFEPEFDGLTIFQNLGRRIARKIPHNFDLFSSELFDLSLDEMRMLLKQKRLNEIRVDASPTIQVEISPYVPTKLRVGASIREEPVMGGESQERTLQMVRSALENALYEINKLHHHPENRRSSNISRRYARSSAETGKK